MNNESNRFSPEVRERAVRMVQEHRGEYPSLGSMQVFRERNFALVKLVIGVQYFVTFVFSCAFGDVVHVLPQLDLNL